MDRKALENKIKKYIIDGGDLIIVKSVDGMRDGTNSKVIHTNKTTYYVDGITNHFHSDYPTSEENLITDDNLCAYLIERLNIFLERLKADYERNKNFIDVVNKQNRIKW